MPMPRNLRSFENSKESAREREREKESSLVCATCDKSLWRPLENWKRRKFSLSCCQFAAITSHVQHLIIWLPQRLHFPLAHAAAAAADSKDLHTRFSQGWANLTYRTLLLQFPHPLPLCLPALICICKVSITSCWTERRLEKRDKER